MVRSATRLIGALALSLAACAGPGATEVVPGREAVQVVALGPQDALAGAEAEEAAALLAAEMADRFAAVLPDGLTSEETALFRRRHQAGAVKSGSPLADLDLSGVSWGLGVPVVMITDRHAVTSAHVPRPVGSRMRFFTKDGWPVDRRVEAKTRIVRLDDGTPADIAVLRLDEAVPGGVAVYPLGAMDEDVAQALTGEGAPLLVTFPKAQATVGTVMRTGAGGKRLVLGVSSQRLGLPEAVGHDVRWGDSGHPWFWMTADGLALASHYHTSEGAGAGPNYAHAAVRAAVEAAVLALDAAP